MSTFVTLSGPDLERAVCDPDAILAELARIQLETGGLLPEGTLDENPLQRSTSSTLQKSRAIVDAYIESKRKALSLLVCDHLHYCELKKRYVYRVELIRSVADCLCMYLTHAPVPIFHLCAYLIEFEFLDRICDCPKQH